MHELKIDGSLQNTIKVLRAVPYFSNLDDAALILVAQSAYGKVYSAEQVVLLEGEPCEGLYSVESGWLKVVKIGLDGREQVLQMLKTGDVFNAISVFTDAPNQATVIAMETSFVWLVRRESLLKMLEEYPSLARQVVKDFAGRVIHLVQMVEDLSLRSVEARLARLLLGHVEGESVPRKSWETQEEIAARLGTVPDVVNRVLRKLSNEGMIQVERSQIRILDKEGLKNIAQVVE
jgi:CRP/FNR family transcriptional regulator